MLPDTTETEWLDGSKSTARKFNLWSSGFVYGFTIGATFVAAMWLVTLVFPA